MLTKKGVVTAAKMKDTVTVTVHRSMFHPIYRKRFRKSKKFLVHAAGEDLAVGDEVIIEECKPISKNKHFRISSVTKRVPRVSDIADESAVDKAIHREKKAPEAPKKADDKKDTSDSSSSDA